MPAVLNAANEVAVAAFLEGRLNFAGIPRVIGEVMSSWGHHMHAESGLDALFAADARARQLATSLLGATVRSAGS